MSTRADDIQVLLAGSAAIHERIKGEYAASLKKKETSDLRLDVKHMLETLRSVLDYLAHDIRETHCTSADPKARFYFPILPDRTKFEDYMKRWFPDLASTCADLWRYLESVQPYHAGYGWLTEFKRVNNESKHDRLVGQERREKLGGTRITTPGVGSISWVPGVRFSRGISVMGAPIDPKSQLPIPRPGQVVERIVWVDFTFEGTQISVQQLLDSAQKGIAKIATEGRRWL